DINCHSADSSGNHWVF
nr:immunoglobulin light chain junction region [Macaca mulatta]MOV67118.1 immunoglobulin light chain junction region [Macaca mulatta]MOV67242.1 immunoglobulin light chain junction region [Macaca mulatta]MOV67629.1 immunoglobulin light chain junction region [Macaca mulatta]MOV71794.1 immunoglobulin light chain junction region [Macaca mulatta]